MRPTNAFEEGERNLFNERMYYKGFAFSNSSTVVYHPENSVIIMPVKRFYNDESELLPTNIVYPGASLGITQTGVLGINLNGVSTGSIVGAPNPNAEYFYINISYNNGTETKYATNAEDLRSVVLYPLPEFVGKATPIEISQGVFYKEGVDDRDLKINSKGEVYKEFEFFNLSSPVKYPYYIEDFIDWVDVQSGRDGLINQTTGLPIKNSFSPISYEWVRHHVKGNIRRPIDGGFNYNNPRNTCK